MKYPQLVSTRAVNAISDWLVSRLEQLGVEAPQIYTRLLLSLLQSTVQINDPIEFNNLETFANRKGNHKRYPPTDTDKLKKLNAVQCLREIVSSDEEISTIESLVDELFEKLKVIEKQSAETEKDDNPFLVNSSSKFHQQSSQHHGKYHSTNKHCNRVDQKPKSDCAGGATEKTHSGDETVADTDTDPKRRYFRAFPALSKEMEESFNIWRQNSKSLTWPMDRNSVSISSSSSSSTVSTSFGSEVGAKAIDLSSSIEKNKRENLDNCDNKNLGSSGVGGGSGGVKRKSRRRRNQTAFSKGNLQNIRKNSFGNPTVSGTGSGGGKHRQRNPSLTCWDTDFEGCWEMGRDLIKEFIVKQNKGNRNRSTSESATYNMKKHDKSKIAHENRDTDKISDVEENVKMSDVDKAPKNVSPLPPLVDISFCDEDYDDNLASVSGSIGASGTDIGTGVVTHRRLYERDVNVSSKELLTKDTSKVDQADFDQFKAKFNSSIEALWKDVDKNVSTSRDVTIDSVSLASNDSQLFSLPIVAPFRENLKNFWSNYYNYHSDDKNISDKKLSDAATKMDDNYASLSCSGIDSGLNNDFVNTSNYYSMPCNMNDFERSVGGARRERTTPISSVFFQNSIWSDQSNVGVVGDSDESFYYKVWNSSKKLNQLGVANKEKLSNYDDSKGLESGIHFPPYNVSKWSEGINAGPNTLQQQQKHMRSKMESVDCVDAGPGCNTTSATYASNWQTPLFGHNLQADLQSWSSSNPMSLTEMYGGGTVNNKQAIEDKRSSSIVDDHDDELDAKPLITLSNHSKETSGFVAYSRVKSFLKTNNVDIFRSGYSVASVSRAKDFNMLGEDENLLTSERTHFYPIKMFADGHTFDIRGSLDDVEYERSASGYLCLESDKYLEYTRIDNFMAEEDGTSTSNSRASTAPLYASSNCEAANDERRAKEKNDFIIRFRMRNNDMACQTEELDEQVEELPMFMIFTDAAQSVKLHGLGPIGNSIHHRNMNTNSQTPYGGSQFVANNDRWLPIGYRNSSVWTAAQSQDAMYGDENEFADGNCVEDDSSCSGSALEQQWSMREIGKKCLMKVHDKSREYESGRHNDAHSLWGMCAACNNDLKSVPANRLLRDELQLEADEIMSDLKYMQDLYICRADTEGEESECETDEYEANKIRSLPKKQHIEKADDNIRMLIDEDDSAVDGTIPMQPHQLVQQQQQQQPQTTDVLQRMNRLIADLLRPEHAAKKIAFDDTGMVGPNGNGRPVPNGLWFEPNARNVWRQTDVTESTTGLQPMQLANALHMENDKFLTQLSWEHDNLAKLWQSVPQSEQSQTESMQSGGNVVCSTEAENSINDAKVQATVAYENLKNLQTFGNNPQPQSAAAAANINSILDQKQSGYPTANQTDVAPAIPTTVAGPTNTDTSAMAVTNAAFKRVQHLLNSNISTNATAKLKLANRKRRHSASQNLFHIPPASVSASKNNNNVDITDLNNFNLKLLASNMITSAAGATMVKPTKTDNDDNNVFGSDINMDTLLNSSLRHALVKKANSGDYDAYEAFGNDLIEPKQTIITCKYWTTIEPMPECIDMVEESGATFSCLLDKNASILKHVTMVTRPLTR